MARPADSNDFRVETARRLVRLSMVGGDQLRGSIFVHGSAHRPRRTEEPADLFNSRDPFFPFETEGGEVLLIAKRRVAEVSGEIGGGDAAGDPAGDAAGGSASLPTALMQVVLADGVVRIGSLRLATRAMQPRLLDHLNRFTDRFLTLFTSEGARLINRELIDRVTPLD